MKAFLIVILSFSFTLGAFGQDYPDSGFTNKSEAKNKMVNGDKNGKWIRWYNNEDGGALADTSGALYYSLSIYKEGKLNGVDRWYYRSGKLFSNAYYIMGKPDGMYKLFYENGKLRWEGFYTNGFKNGLAKEYYESGKLKSETTYHHDTIVDTINYDTNGNEIK